MQNRVRLANIETIIMNQWAGQTIPRGLLEQRILEMESMGLVDSEEHEGMPESFAPIRHRLPAA